jgi:transcriptional regulator with XRE-family HTH domain
MKRSNLNPLRVPALRRWRVEHGLTLLDLADLLGLSEGYISRIERGERAVPPLLRVRISRLLDARVADLFPPEAIEDPEEGAR